jgi:hypothetical protein
MRFRSTTWICTIRYAVSIVVAAVIAQFGSGFGWHTKYVPTAVRVFAVDGAVVVIVLTILTSGTGKLARQGGDHIGAGVIKGFARPIVGTTSSNGQSTTRKRAPKGRKKAVTEDLIWDTLPHDGFQWLIHGKKPVRLKKTKGGRCLVPSASAAFALDMVRC